MNMPIDLVKKVSIPAADAIKLGRPEMEYKLPLPLTIAFKILALADWNKDGKLSKSEWKAAGLEQAFGRFEGVKGHQDGITASELWPRETLNNSPKLAHSKIA